MSTSTAEKISSFLDILGNKELSELPQEEIVELYKKMSPYGRTIAGSGQFLNFSLTQISHKYWEKFIITSMIAYLNRMCDEWQVPANVPVVSVYDYLDDPKKLDTPEMILEKNNESAIYDYEFNRKAMAKRIIVKQFLEEMFQFNPDEHVRSAYRPNYKDKSRPILDTMAARLAINTAVKSDNDLRTDKSLHDIATGVKMKKVKKTIKGRDGKIREIIKEVPVDPVPPTKMEPADPEHLANKAKPDPAAYSTAVNFIPPHDMFGKFKMYREENYEQLREAVAALYCEKPDLELAINPYGVFNTLEEAEKHKKQHADEVIAEVFTVETGKWNMFDTFKEQRDRVEYFNKNTAILEEMTKQLERDSKLGQDLMAKRVQKEKKKNIIESGPDAENFAKWRKENPTLEKLGAKYIGDMADEDMPEDSVQVDVWRLGEGGAKLTKDKFYSKAEAPTFINEGASASK